MRLPRPRIYKFTTFFQKANDKTIQKYVASRSLINKAISPAQPELYFGIGGAFLLKPINVGGHAAYQDPFLTQLRKYYPDAASSLPAHTWNIMEKFRNLALSEVDFLMQDRYSVLGLEPRLPSDMLRSVLVPVEFQVVSYTKWAADLKEDHLHAIISGFHVGDTPGVGTLADFFSRLWLSVKIISLILSIRQNKSLRDRKKKEKRLHWLIKSLLKIFSESLKKIRLRM